MKKLLTIISFVFFFISAYAGDNTKLIGTAKPVKDTTIKAINYTIYLGAKGGRFIIVTSKSGNQYKKYLPKL